MGVTVGFFFLALFITICCVRIHCKRVKWRQNCFRSCVKDNTASARPLQQQKPVLHPIVSDVPIGKSLVVSESLPKNLTQIAYLIKTNKLKDP